MECMETQPFKLIREYLTLKSKEGAPCLKRTGRAKKRGKDLWQRRVQRPTSEAVPSSTRAEPPPHRGAATQEPEWKIKRAGGASGL